MSSWAKLEEEASVAVSLFKECLPGLSKRHSPLLASLLGFFIWVFDFNVKPGSLPVHNVYESDDIARIRTSVVSRFILEYRLALRPKPALMITDAQELKMLKLGTTILYWFLNDPSAVQIREKKASRTELKELLEYAIEGSRRIVHTTIDYRSERPILDTIALLTGVPAPPTPIFPDLNRPDLCIGYDDATDEAVHAELERNDSRRETQSNDLSEAPLKVEPMNMDEKMASNDRPLHVGNVGGARSRHRKRLPKGTSLPPSQQGHIAYDELPRSEIRTRPGKPHRGRYPTTKDATRPLQTTSDASIHGLSELVGFKMLEQRPSFEEPQEASPDVPSLGTVDYVSILNRVLEMTATRHKSRYGVFFDSELASNVKETLIATLTPAVINAFEKGIHGLEDLQNIGGEPEALQDAGIYLHILWNGPRIFWLYIGQAVNLSVRIADHKNIGYRKRHPSLHYHVWNSLEDIGSLFVKLANLNGAKWQEAKLPGLGQPLAYILNLLEMWLCCAFQTLTSDILDDFLPPDIPRVWAGLHLNVAAPVWQRFPHESLVVNPEIGRQTYLQFLFSEDLARRQWAEGIRDSYHGLRCSPQKLFREYYFRQQTQSSQRGVKQAQIYMIQKYSLFLQNGILTIIYPHEASAWRIVFNDFRFTVPYAVRQDWSLEQGDPVYLVPFLMERPHPLRYAREALPTDPASRLLIGMRAIDGQKQAWLFAKGKITVDRMNRLVDIFEGVPYEESLEREELRRQKANMKKTEQASKE